MTTLSYLVDDCIVLLNDSSVPEPSSSLLCAILLEAALYLLAHMHSYLEGQGCAAERREHTGVGDAASKILYVLDELHARDKLDEVLNAVPVALRSYVSVFVLPQLAESTGTDTHTLALLGLAVQAEERSAMRTDLFQQTPRHNHTHVSALPHWVGHVAPLGSQLLAGALVRRKEPAVPYHAFSDRHVALVHRQLRACHRLLDEGERLGRPHNSGWPDEALAHVLGFLSFKRALRRMGCVCTDFHRVATSNALWREFYGRRYDCTPELSMLCEHLQDHAFKILSLDLDRSNTRYLTAGWECIERALGRRQTNSMMVCSCETGSNGEPGRSAGGCLLTIGSHAWLRLFKASTRNLHSLFND
jgi:hypothetical protein